MPYKFKAGDRVQVVNLREAINGSDYNIKNGMTGTVIENGSDRPWVEFDDYIGGHCSYAGSQRGKTMCMWEDEIDFIHTYNQSTEITINGIPISTYTQVTLNKEGEKNMRILNIYEYRKINELEQEFKEEEKKILLEDPFHAIIEQTKKQIRDLYKNEYDKDLSETDIVLTSAVVLMSKETQEKVENIRKNYMDIKKNLDKLLEEVNAQLELTDDYDKQIAILKNYEILDENGQINAW